MELTDLSATKLSALISQRELAPSDLMAACLKRVAAVNPALNAVISLRDPDELMAEARRADDAPAEGWLHGIPFAVKDLVATKGLRTTWGSPLFANHVPQADDLVAARLRAAGTIFIGKTNTPEWGHGSHSFNPVHGVTRNPYDLTRSAGGSSGGAAAALAARMVSVADGSDMMGSLRNPAAFCNVYGFRPSWGTIPMDAGGDSYLHTLSTDGPMARNPQDLARLLDTLSGPNPEVPFGRAKAPLATLEPSRINGLRIGWLGDWGGAYEFEPGIADLGLAAAKVFEEMGAVITALPPLFDASRLWQSWITLRAMLNAGSMRDRYEDPARRAQLKPETQWEIERGQGLSAADVYAASIIRSEWYAKAARTFSQYDALMMPAAQVWPFPADWRWPQAINDRKMDTYHRWMEVVVPVSLIGLPSLCLPAGFGADGLPTGVQLFGPMGADAKILGLGEAYHQATDWPGQRPPLLS